mgnify:FL=1
MQQQNMGERTPQGTPRHAGPKPLNTPEELRAIRQAMDEGKNPLLATGVPRWEDQVGVSRIINAVCWSSNRCPPRPRCGGTAS